MTTNTEKLSALHRKNMETAMRLAQLSVDNSQRVMALQAALAKSLYAASVKNAKAQAKVKNPQELLRLQTDYTRESLTRVVEVAKQVSEIGNEARADFSQLLAEQLVAVVDQQYLGDVTIHPPIRSRDYVRVLGNLSHNEFRAWVLTGERATWPKIAMIRDQTTIGQTLEDCIIRLKKQRNRVSVVEAPQTTVAASVASRARRKRAA